MRLLLSTILIIASLAVPRLATAKAAKPSPEKCVELLQSGNERFVTGHSIHPRTDGSRLAQAGRENQGDHAYATVITCSDSRVPVERVFDAGVMDIFVIRVAGNVCDTDEVGSIEYGLCHVHTPVLVVLGHTQCGAVTAVTAAVEGHGHALERNIPPLVDNIQPAVERAKSNHPHLHGKDIIPHGIEENVWQSIEDLYMSSPASRQLVHQGKAKVLGAIYDVSNGKVKWLPEAKSLSILNRVEKDPLRAMEAMASAGHSSNEGHGDHSDKSLESHSTASVQRVELIKSERLSELDKQRKEKIALENVDLNANPEASSDLPLLFGSLLIACVIGGGFLYKSSFSNSMSLSSKLYSGFGMLIILTIAVGYGGYHFMTVVSEDLHKEALALELDMKSGQLAACQNEFVLYGIGDKERGEALLKEANSILAEFPVLCKSLKDMDLDKDENTSIGQIEKNVEKYKKSFAELSKRYHEIEELKEKMDEYGEQMNEQLAEVILEHENELAKLESSRRTNRKRLALQTRLVEELFEAEVACAKAQRGTLEFLLTKHTKVVPHLEGELGKLKKHLTNSAEFINKQAANENEKKQDLAKILGLQHEVDNYNTSLSKVIVDELEVEEDLKECSANVENVGAISAIFGKRMETIAEQAKHRANMASLMLIALSAIFGSILAFTFVRQITTTIDNSVEALTFGSEQVAEASEIVSQSSQEMAMGTSEQASSLEEISSSLEEMTSMTKQNADNANQAQDMSKNTSVSTTKGIQAMNRMTEAINLIKNSADETAKIIKTIDEIAFQTNLLALNAAVEAARAGEAGKGFAVVAEEVRNLAQRSAEAAKNTASLIGDSQKNAEGGVSVSKEVQELLVDIGSGVEKVTTIVGEVAAASQEQSQGINQINEAVAQLDTATQSNASSAEEAASTSEELSSQAIALRQVVGGLKAMIDGSSQEVTASGDKTKIAPKAARPQPSKVSASTNLVHERQHSAPMAKASMQTSSLPMSPAAIMPLGEDELADF